MTAFIDKIGFLGVSDYIKKMDNIQIDYIHYDEVQFRWDLINSPQTGGTIGYMQIFNNVSNAWENDQNTDDQGRINDYRTDITCRNLTQSTQYKFRILSVQVINGITYLIPAKFYNITTPINRLFPQDYAYTTGTTYVIPYDDSQVVAQGLAVDMIISLYSGDTTNIFLSAITTTLVSGNTSVSFTDLNQWTKYSVVFSYHDSQANLYTSTNVIIRWVTSFDYVIPVVTNIQGTPDGGIIEFTHSATPQTSYDLYVSWTQDWYEYHMVKIPTDTSGYTYTGITGSDFFAMISTYPSGSTPTDPWNGYDNALFQIQLASFTSGITTYDTVGQHVFTLPAGCTTLEYLVVAGGGAGGGYDYGFGGGGGAGGYLVGNISNPVAGDYNIFVGSGGTGSTTNGGQTAGGNSSISGASLNIVAIGGGFGGYGAGDDTGMNGGNGGSGGGAGSDGNGNAGTGGTGIYGQGYSSVMIDPGNGSGGGGASGGNLGGTPDIGGAGTYNSISGSNVLYSKGGNGGADGNATLYGSGGNGAVVINTGGNGGSGIIIIRYV